MHEGGGERRSERVIGKHLAEAPTPLPAAAGWWSFSPRSPKRWVACHENFSQRKHMETFTCTRCDFIGPFCYFRAHRQGILTKHCSSCREDYRAKLAARSAHLEPSVHQGDATAPSPLPKNRDRFICTPQSFYLESLA